MALFTDDTYKVITVKFRLTNVKIISCVQMRRANKKRITLVTEQQQTSQVETRYPNMKEKRKIEAKFSEKLSKVVYGWISRDKQEQTLRSDGYEIRGLICEGTFGKVLMAVNMHTKLTAAAKIELISAHSPQLNTEYQIYERLGCEKPGFIKIYHFGPCTKKLYNILIMELLGPDLDDLFVTCRRIFSHKTVLMIAIQTLEIMKHIHSCNVIYRDVKPENFCIGNIIHRKEKMIHIIDFGLSKINDVGGAQAAATKNVTDIVQIDYLIGTARYMSINAHFAFDQSARDDLESLGYMYIYFLKGTLPWMGLSNTGSIEDHYRGIAQIKTTTKPEDLIFEYPEFGEYLNYVRMLNINEVPDYEYLIKLMKDALQLNGFTNDNIFDWSDIMNERYLKRALAIDPDE